MKKVRSGIVLSSALTGNNISQQQDKFPFFSLSYLCYLPVDSHHEHKPDTNVSNLISVEVTINTVYVPLLTYYPLLKDVLFIAPCFGSVEPS
jgi:hypothetical protein